MQSTCPSAAMHPAEESAVNHARFLHATLQDDDFVAQTLGECKRNVSLWELPAWVSNDIDRICAHVAECVMQAALRELRRDELQRWSLADNQISNRDISLPPDARNRQRILRFASCFRHNMECLVHCGHRDCDWQTITEFDALVRNTQGIVIFDATASKTLKEKVSKSNPLLEDLDRSLQQYDERHVAKVYLQTRGNDEATVVPEQAGAFAVRTAVDIHDRCMAVAKHLQANKQSQRRPPTLMGAKRRNGRS